MAARFHWDVSRTLVMGVLNVTPDSFSDGGKFFAVERAVGHGRAMVAAGADIVDVGGESTRPGAAPVSADEELRRVLPVIERLASCESPITDHESRVTGHEPRITISIDTTKAVVARQAVAAGAAIVNDISALRFDAEMVAVLRDCGAGLVLMHMQGDPRTMQRQPHYADVVREVREFLAERIEFAVGQGIEKTRIAIDPGIGFGKTAAHNLELLGRLAEFGSLGCPVLVGTSRKSFIGQTLGREPAGRVWGTAASVAWAVAQGAGMVRVHDVAEMVDVVRLTAALRAAAGRADSGRARGSPRGRVATARGSRRRGSTRTGQGGK